MCASIGKGTGSTHEEEQPEEEAVEVGREETEVVVRRRGHAVQDRGDGVEDEHRSRVGDKQPDCHVVQSVTAKET